MKVSLLLRPPVVWIVLAEAVLVLAIGIAAWHLWAARQAPAVAVAPRTLGPIAPAPPPPSPPTSPLAPAPPTAGPTPGIRTDPQFLSRQLDELNRVEATFEDLEWRVTKAIADAIQRYVNGVVLPSVDRSEVRP